MRSLSGPYALLPAAAAVVPIIFCSLRGVLDPVPAWPSHFWLILVGITSQSIGYLVISISLPRLPVGLVSIILLAQPVATVVLARALLDETPSSVQLLGVALVIGGGSRPTSPAPRRGAR